MLNELIESAVILPKLAASTKGDVLLEIVDAMIAARRLQAARRQAVLALLEQREALGSTGIGNGIAVPHVRSELVGTLSLALARAPDGIDYQAIDGRPVRTVFLLLAPEDRPDAHLRALRWVSSLARNADFRRFVQSATTDADIRELLHEMSQPA